MSRQDSIEKDAQDAIDKEFNAYLAAISAAYSEPVVEAFSRRETDFAESLERTLARFEDTANQSLEMNRHVLESFKVVADSQYVAVAQMQQQADENLRKEVETLRQVMVQNLSKWETTTNQALAEMRAVNGQLEEFRKVHLETMAQTRKGLMEDRKAADEKAAADIKSLKRRLTTWFIIQSLLMFLLFIGILSNG